MGDRAGRSRRTGTAACSARDGGAAGNGRVYHIGFSADDGNGGSCTGTVLVKVKGATAKIVDNGATFDSTA